MSTDLEAAMATYTAARSAAYAADEAWSAELNKAFGRAAGDARYDARGESTPQLLKLWEARRAASLETQVALDVLKTLRKSMSDL